MEGTWLGSLTGSVPGWDLLRLPMEGTWLGPLTGSVPVWDLLRLAWKYLARTPHWLCICLGPLDTTLEVPNWGSSSSLALYLAGTS